MSQPLAEPPHQPPATERQVRSHAAELVKLADISAESSILNEMRLDRDGLWSSKEYKLQAAGGGSVSSITTPRNPESAART